MSRHEEVRVPPDLAVRLEELVEKIVATLKTSVEVENGPQMVIQCMLLTLVRIASVSNSDVEDKLKQAVEVACQQYREMDLS